MSAEYLNELLDNHVQSEGYTHIGAALNFVAQYVFTEVNGDRQGVPHVLILMTDGKSQDDVKNGANVSSAFDVIRLSLLKQF